ncbi:DUF2809 domain-containing protein [Sphingobacterium multivorum]|jgi:hypothetical protein|uniref:DUF2809 domain-containing protein n=1 Tax=Sphingobacterium multivorum TaxID=28454 RepID=A0ABX7CU79_SPHMU|nr:DUF2809 domain-containing protein [Sphingobacterium multivorum]QQT33399.1 DUF2809 domain-containing protein [Sphingobacterium multivorum]QQT55668.1 DUF2809 domain-containing protein [Sphingobacterium multivorum]
MKPKIYYLLRVALTIFLGLLSRKISAIPTITGDVLYAVMIYWLSRFLFTRKSLLFSFTTTLIFCFAIEFLQLVQHPLLIWVRNNPLLRLVFGQGFLWSDLVAYCLGTVGAACIDYLNYQMLKTDPTLRTK